MMIPLRDDDSGRLHVIPAVCIWFRPFAHDSAGGWRGSGWNQWRRAKSSGTPAKCTPG